MIAAVNEAETFGASWLAAAADMDVQVELLDNCVLVTDFGGSSGTLCSVRRTEDEEKQPRRGAESRGAFCAVLSESYLAYDRELFRETLDNWGWFGQGPPPS